MSAAHASDAYAFSPPRAGILRDYGLEPAGTAFQRHAQIRIHHHRHDILAWPGVCSFGRSVAAFLPEFDRRGFGDLVAWFKRVLIIGTEKELDTATWIVRRFGATVTGNMHVLEAPADRFLTPALAKLSGPAGLDDIHHGALDPDAAPETVREVQNLLQACGLTPLPGALLRGHQGPSITTVLYDSSGRLIATGTAVDLANVGPDQVATAMLLAGAVAPDHQGRGLGVRLGAAMLVAARNQLGTARALGIVEPGNIRSLRMNARFGLTVRHDMHARYVEAGPAWA